jgi:hypothetical protein
VGRRALPRDFLDRLVAVVRLRPDAKLTELAREVGCDWRAVKHRLPEAHAKIVEEQQQARARVELERREVAAFRSEVPELAQQDAVAARARQGVAARGLLDLVEDARKIGERVVRHGGRLAEVLEARGVDGMSATEALVALTRSATYLRSLGESVERAIRLERLVLGEPSEIISVQHVPTTAETREELERLKRDLESMEAVNDLQ